MKKQTSCFKNLRQSVHFASVVNRFTTSIFLISSTWLFSCFESYDSISALKKNKILQKYNSHVYKLHFCLYVQIKKKILFCYVLAISSL